VGDLITVKFNGHACHFDTEGINLEKPGAIYAPLTRGKFYEQDFLSYIASLKIRGTYVDVGACFGTHSVFFAMICQADHVFAFEPRESQRARLERTLKLNNLLDKVTVSPWALAETKGQTTVELDGREQTLHTDRLDHLLNQPIALIKIDVEGMEPQVLAGATDLLRRYQPRIFAEAHTDEEFERVYDCLRPFGYTATGRVFNASPTYEFIVPPPSWTRLPKAGKHIAKSSLKLILPLQVRRFIRRTTAR
jgi:hypothetical protein